MESPKYLIIITLIDGQNFTVPDGAPDKIEATFYAEARFGNESILKSDPIKLTSSNPEFVTELAWQLDKRSLHQLRVERRVIKLQVFVETREKKKINRQKDDQTYDHHPNDTSPTHKIELIGYTVLDIRSAQETKQPKFTWLPLLNPKFRKSSYNRPEVQLALTLTRLDEENSAENCDSNSFQANGLQVMSHQNHLESLEFQSESFISDCGSSMDDSRLYKTCLDFTVDSSRDTAVEKDEIIENDIKILSKEGSIYIYDTQSENKSRIEDCVERYKITVTIPFNSELDSLVKEPADRYYFSVVLFGTTVKSEYFIELTSVETKEVYFDVRTTHSSILKTYFELNSNLVIKLYQANCGEALGLATVQIDQLCSVDAKRRSLEGIFALQSMSDHDTFDAHPAIHPTIGVSVVLEKIAEAENDMKEQGQDILDQQEPRDIRRLSTEHLDLAKQHFGEDIDDFLYNTLNDTHQLTLEDSRLDNDATPTAHKPITTGDEINELHQDSHHFCFTIDLKNFFYTQEQRLIPTLRELVVRYSYPFFGYKDTITTDASIPISTSNSIIVSGFCEFNFATTIDSLLTALAEIPLELEILTNDPVRRIETSADHSERKVGTSSLNFAQTLNLSESNIARLREKAIDTTVSVPIYALNGDEIGELQIYLCLKDLGEPTFRFRSSVESLNTCVNQSAQENQTTCNTNSIDTKKIDDFISDTKCGLESWKDEFFDKITQELKKSENERFKRIYQRFEARDAKREQDFKRRMDELSTLERRYKESLGHIESLEKRLSNNFEQMKTKEALLDTRLDTLDLKISKGIESIKSEYEKRIDALPASIKYQRSSTGDNHIDSRTITRVSSKQPHQSAISTESNNLQSRRSSLKNTTSTVSACIPVPVRSSSLVRGPMDRSSTTTRLISRPTGVVATVVNHTRPTKLNLSKETQDKLAKLRKERAILMRRRPNDTLIQEINTMIEQLTS